MGNKVYEINLVNYNDSIGNSFIEYLAPSSIKDGFTSVGDIDGDGMLDIVIVSDVERDGGGIFVWNPRTEALIASTEAGIDGGVAFIGDIDGDCFPEIGMTFKNELRLYRFDETTELKLVWKINTSDNSGRTGVTMFDLNQDRRQELIYRDETSLRIFNGETGTTIDSIPIYSGTGIEYPVIADINNDGQAEILVEGRELGMDKSRISCFESAGTPWAPARSVWNQYSYNPTQVNDDLTIPRYQQNAAQPLQGTENCPRETCNTPYNNFMVQATYRTQEGCYVWPELQRDLSITASSRCLGDSIEICLYASSTDSLILGNGVTVSCYAPPWDDGTDLLLDSLTITSDTTCIMLPMTSGIDSIIIVINDEGGFYPPDLPNTDIQECDYTNNEFVLQLDGPDFTIDILDYECSPDSLIFYIATDNVGLDTDVSYIGGGCYFTDPYIGNGVVVTPIEYTNWCFDFDTTMMTYQYQDTFRVAISHPIGHSQMWWTINEGGFGPGLLSSQVTGIYECNYDNNVDHILFDISEKEIDLGPDIVKCLSEVFTLNARQGFDSYLWNDLTTDSIYSSRYEGLHYVEATDQCGRIYRDSIEVIFDMSNNIDLGEDIVLCSAQDTTITLLGDFNEVNWYPSDAVDCATCNTVLVTIDTSMSLIVSGAKGNCVSFDTMEVIRLIPVVDSSQASYCTGDTIDFGDQKIYETGVYTYLAQDCSVINVLEAEFNSNDTTFQEAPICQGDSIQIENTWYFGGESVEVIENTAEGCDSIITLSVEVVDILSDEAPIIFCVGDSMLLHNQWIKESGEYPELFQAQSGCDSVFTYIVTTMPSSAATVERQICEGDSVIIESEIFITEGIFEIITEASNGCDSIITLNLETLARSTGSSDMEFCMGDSLFIDDQWIYESVEYEIILQNNVGCYSIVTVSVTELPMELVADSLFACSGDSILLSGNYYFANQVVSDTIWDDVCPKLRNTTLSFVDLLTTAESIIICQGDTVSVGSLQIFESGTYPISFISERGCDSVHTITLSTLEPIFDLPSDTLLENGGIYEYLLLIDTSVWSVSWTSDDIVIDCESCLFQTWDISETTNITLDIFSDDGCEVSHTFQIELKDSDEIVYPNIFTPNGDGINDEWILDMTNYPTNSLQIYDRWGNKIFAQKNVDIISWDGRTNNQAVNPGVYIFMLEYLDLEGGEEVIFGDIR